MSRLREGNTSSFETRGYSHFSNNPSDTDPQQQDYPLGQTSSSSSRFSRIARPRDDPWGNVPEDILVRMDGPPFPGHSAELPGTTIGTTGWSDEPGAFPSNGDGVPFTRRGSVSVPWRPRLLASSSVSGDPPHPVANSTERLRSHARIRMVDALLASSRSFHSLLQSRLQQNRQISEQNSPFINPDAPAVRSTLFRAQDARDLDTEVDAMMGTLRSGSRNAEVTDQRMQSASNHAVNGREITQFPLFNQSTPPVLSPGRSALQSPQPPTTHTSVNIIGPLVTSAVHNRPLSQSVVPVIREPESPAPPQASPWSSLHVAANLAISSSPPLPPLNITATQQMQTPSQVHQQSTPGGSSPFLQRSPPLAALASSHSESGSAITSPRLGSRGRRDFSPGFGAIRVRSPRAVGARSSLGADAGADATGVGRLPPAAINDDGNGSASTVDAGANNPRPTEPQTTERVSVTGLGRRLSNK